MCTVFLISHLNYSFVKASKWSDFYPPKNNIKVISSTGTRTARSHNCHVLVRVRTMPLEHTRGVAEDAGTNRGVPVVTTTMWAAIWPEKSISAATVKEQTSDKQRDAGTVCVTEGLCCWFLIYLHELCLWAVLGSSSCLCVVSTPASLSTARTQVLEGYGPTAEPTNTEWKGWRCRPDRRNTTSKTDLSSTPYQSKGYHEVH